MKQFLRRYWPIILILTVSIVTRFYRLPSTITFLEDEGRDLLVVKRMSDTGRPVLIGPQTSTGNMYLGPLYYYLITPPLVLASFNPIGPVVFIAITGVITVLLIYLMMNKWFGPKSAILAALLYAIMPYTVSFTRNSWNPNLAPLISLLILWVLSKLNPTTKFSWKLFLFLGILVGILIQLHYMALVMVALVGLSLLFSYRKHLLSLLRGSLIALVGFVFILSPFIVFEVRNDFVNTNAMSRFITSADAPNIRYSLPFWLWKNKVVSTSTRLIGSQWGKTAFIPEDPSANIITLAFVFLSLLILYDQRKNRPFRLLSLIFFGSLAIIGIYQEYIHMHYLGYLLSFSYLIIAAGLASQKRYLRVLVGIFATATICFSIPTLYTYLQSGPTNQADRAREVIEYVTSQANGEPYNLISATATYTTPYQYFAFLSDNPPSNAFSETLFIICQDRACEDGDLESHLLYITGPSHPTLINYLGHPLYNYYDGMRTVLSNEHVSTGAWVAKLKVEKPESP